MKTCPDCGIEKPLNGGFPPKKKVRCVSCAAKRRHDYYLATRERQRKRQAEYRAENLELIKEQQRSWRAANRQDLRERQFQRSYGITWADRDAMLAEQGGVCANPGCATPDPGKRGWHVDHDHACCPERARSCGKCIRGILCGDCNVMLGNARDDADVLAGAIEYLRDNQMTRRAAPAA